MYTHTYTSLVRDNTRNILPLALHQIIFDDENVFSKRNTTSSFVFFSEKYKMFAAKPAFIYIREETYVNSF